MSDPTPEDGGEQPQFHFIPIPPEIADQARQAHDRQHMAADSARHEVMRLLDELNEKQLLSLRSLLVGCSNSKSVTNFHLGAVSQMLAERFGICVACGEKHDEALNEFLNEGKTEMEAAEFDTAPSTLNIADAAAKYNMLLLERDDSHAHSGGGWYCAGCGMKYASLEDRMRREPGVDGCHGCQTKAGHG